MLNEYLIIFCHVTFYKYFLLVGVKVQYFFSLHSYIHAS